MQALALLAGIEPFKKPCPAPEGAEEELFSPVYSSEGIPGLTQLAPRDPSGDREEEYNVNFAFRCTTSGEYDCDSCEAKGRFPWVEPGTNG